ncbi:hypothetical protein JHK84_040869 [Glycine max]|nr:hypothetical protein JHK86_040655 [Glycine max]KAG4966273.1 hypothetical protein JHK85_041248 [Glycine max]KAG5122529.1 hypothetical protein JHK84_040869 [Glycine max]
MTNKVKGKGKEVAGKGYAGKRKGAFDDDKTDFFSSLRARVYDDEVRKWIFVVGVDFIGKKLVNLVMTSLDLQPLTN